MTRQVTVRPNLDPLYLPFEMLANVGRYSIELHETHQLISTMSLQRHPRLSVEGLSRGRI